MTHRSLTHKAVYAAVLAGLTVANVGSKKSHAADPMASATMDYEWDGFDLESGSVYETPPGDPSAPEVDFYLAYNADTDVHARVFQEYPASIAMLDGLPADDVGCEHLQGLAFTQDVIDEPPYADDTLIIVTADGNTFKVGNMVEHEDYTVTFDYQQMNCAEPDLLLQTFEGLAALEGIIANDPDALFADKVEDALAQAETALDELTNDRPDNQAAMGPIEGTVGDLCAAVEEGLDSDLGTQLMDELVGLARGLAVMPIDEAISQGCDQDVIDKAQDSLDEGDMLRDAGNAVDCTAFKDAVNKYKDALVTAEGALPSCPG